MRFLASAALFVVAILILAQLAPVQLSAAHANPASPGICSAGSSRAVDGSTRLAPDWFGGKWWKKFSRAMKRFLEFIDGLIDDLRGHPGDEPGTGGGPKLGALGGQAPYRPALAENPHLLLI